MHPTSPAAETAARIASQWRTETEQAIAELEAEFCDAAERGDRDAAESAAADVENLAFLGELRGVLFGGAR